MLIRRLRSRTNKSTGDVYWDKHCWLIGGAGSLLLASIEPEIYKFTATQGFAWSAALITLWAGAWSGVLPIYLAWKARRRSFLWASMPIFVCGMPLNLHYHTSLALAAQSAGMLLTLSVTMWCIGIALRYKVKRSTAFLQPAPIATASVIEVHEDAAVWPPAPRRR